MSRFLYSTAVKTLTDVVKELNLAQGNFVGNHFVATLNHAKWVWKDLNYSNFWGVVQTAVPVVDGKITLPQNVSRLLNISVVDKCGNIQPLGHNPNINTYTLKCPVKTCTCKCGGKGTYCGDVDNLQVTTEQVEINGTEYTKTIYTKHDGAGNIVKETHTPVWDTVAEDVIIVTTTEVIFTVDINQDGCIKVTEPNRRKLVERCGCYIPFIWRASCLTGLCNHKYVCDECRVALKPYLNDFGYYNWDAVAKDVIHLKDVTATQVIIVYQTNGEPEGAEILVPEYAVDALMLGIMFRRAKFSPLTSYGETEYAKRQYNHAKNKIFEFLNPLRMDDFVKLAGVIPKWG